MEPTAPQPDPVVAFMRSRPVTGFVLSPIMVVYFLWLYPVWRGISVARSKGFSPRWMWFGVHPLGGWIAYAVLKAAAPRSQADGKRVEGPIAVETLITVKLLHRRPRRLRGRMLRSWWTSTVQASEHGLELTTYLPVYTLLSIFPLFALALVAYVLESLQPNRSPEYLGYPSWFDSPSVVSGSMFWVGLILVHAFARKRVVWQLGWEDVLRITTSDQTRAIWIEASRQKVPLKWYMSAQRYWRVCGLDLRDGYELFKGMLNRMAPAHKFTPA